MIQNLTDSTIPCYDTYTVYRTPSEAFYILKDKIILSSDPYYIMNISFYFDYVHSDFAHVDVLTAISTEEMRGVSY